MEYIWAHTRYLKAQTEEANRWTALTAEQKQEALAILSEKGEFSGAVES